MICVYYRYSVLWPNVQHRLCNVHACFKSVEKKTNQDCMLHIHEFHTRERKKQQKEESTMVSLCFFVHSFFFVCESMANSSQPNEFDNFCCVCVWSPLFLLPPKRIGSFKRKNGKKMLNRKNSEQQQQEILYFNGIERWSIHTCLLVDSIPYVLVLSVHKAVGGSCCKKSFLSFVWIEIIRSDSFSCIIFVACA